ncbi:hypothetical protein GCM10020331_002980 [Ectobacillus funiculus]
MENGIDIVYYGGEMTLDTYLNNAPPVPDKVDSNGILHKQKKQYSKQERESQKKLFTHVVNTKLIKIKIKKLRNHGFSYLVTLLQIIIFVIADAFGYRKKINNKGKVFNPDTNSYEKGRFFYSTN